ncbi:E3 ubiquitin-protein ligase DTX4-like [Gigantopelta aegis]|uniref:E3 ubiquitin-protein ligase DTX4-like n=1 Tax=Gigantopelta aegis TaxID=1735272 RepID=UPI001B887A1A|nr:E3 ubiquitin-protein ligase DTX4-like [Gigantopelta aegis]XP_041361524.1 E3 ubiquitin-protein ligase DTX4-like [Gigantopelta aegis]
MYKKYKSEKRTEEYVMSEASSRPSSDQGTKEFTTKHNIKVKVFSADISKVPTKAVVAEVNGKPPDELPPETTLLYQAVGPQLRTIEKESTCQEGILISRTGGTKLKIDLLFHVHIIAFSSKNPDVWVGEMKKTYEGIFKTANLRKIRSLTMPLLSGGAPTDVAAEAVVRAIAAYKSSGTVREFNIVTLDRKLTSEIVSVCKQIFQNQSEIESDASQNYEPESSTSGDLKKKTLEKTNAKHGTEKLKQRTRKSLDSSTNATSSEITVDQLAIIDNSNQRNGPLKNDDGLDNGKSSSEGSTGNASKIPVKKSGQTAVVNGATGDAIHGNDVGKDEDGEKDDVDDDSPNDDAKRVEKEVKKGGNQDETAAEKEERKQEEDDNTCVICMDTITDRKKLEKCGHVFCRACIDKCFQTFKPICPSCNTVYGIIMGDQPPGSMTCTTASDRLPGYEQYSTIVINYSFSNGIQTKDHPHPGKLYYGTHRTAYLPDSPDGRKVRRLLQKAFDRKLTFTVGRSATTGKDDCVIWNDIHHKTNTHGGAQGFGYPDSTYLTRVQEELASKGVTDD